MGVVRSGRLARDGGARRGHSGWRTPGDAHPNPILVGRWNSCRGRSTRHVDMAHQPGLSSLLPATRTKLSVGRLPMRLASRWTSTTSPPSPASRSGPSIDDGRSPADWPCRCSKSTRLRQAPSGLLPAHDDPPSGVPLPVAGPQRSPPRVAGTVDRHGCVAAPGCRGPRGLSAACPPVSVRRLAAGEASSLGTTPVWCLRGPGTDGPRQAIGQGSTTSTVNRMIAVLPGGWQRARQHAWLLPYGLVCRSHQLEGSTFWSAGRGPVLAEGDSCGGAA